MPTLPVLRADGAKSAGTTGALTVTAPAGVATGDLEILIAEVRTADTCSITTNGGGAWTAMTGTPVSTTASEKLYVWYRQRVGGDTDPQVTPSADHCCAARLAVTTGTYDTSDPFDIETTGTEATVDNSFSFAPGTSTSQNNALVCVLSTILRDSNVASVPICTDANLTNLVSHINYCTTSGAGGGFGMTSGTLATAGAVGTFACTYAATSAKAYISFAVKPAATVTGQTLTLTAVQTPTMSRVLAALRTLSATQVQTPTLAEQVAYLRTLSATQVQTATLTAQKSFPRTLSATQIQTATMSRQVAYARTLSATQVQVPTMARALAALRTLSVTQTQTPTMARVLAASKTLSATQTQTATASRVLAAFRTLAATQVQTALLGRFLAASRALSATQVQVPTLGTLFVPGGGANTPQALAAVQVQVATLVATLVPAATALTLVTSVTRTLVSASAAAPGAAGSIDPALAAGGVGGPRVLASVGPTSTITTSVKET